MSQQFTKRTCPTAARDYFDFIQVFGDGIEWTAVRDGDTVIGHSWKLQCALCDEPIAVKIRGEGYCIPCALHVSN